MFSFINRYLGEYLQSIGRQWVVNERDIEEYIKAMKLKGVKDKTLKDRLHYIHNALAEMN